MKVSLGRNKDNFIEVPDVPTFYESFNYKNVIGIYPIINDLKTQVDFEIFSAEAGNMKKSTLTGVQLKEAYLGEIALMGTLQRQAFYILTQNTGYGSKISESEYRQYYCSRVSQITPPGVYVMSNDFDGEIIS